MNTQTHIIMGAALFGRDIPKRAWIGALGGFLPDAPMLSIVLALKLFGLPDALIFGTLYWQDWWQITNAITHNFFLWGGLLVLGVTMRERIVATVEDFDRWTLTAVFAGSALLHTAVDFLVHREDAHMSFWPLTRWKFVSPVSYWDNAHYGQYVGLFELAIGLILTFVLLRRFANVWVRGTLGLAVVLYVAVPVYFMTH